MSIHYYFGEDTYQARQAINDVAHKGSATIRWLDREDIITTPLSQHLGQANGLFGRALLVLRDVVAWPKALQESVITALSEAVSAEIVVWDRGVVPPSKQLKISGKQVLSKHFTYAEPAKVATWLVEEAKKRGGELEAAAARLLIERLGGDRWQLLNQIETLLLRHEVITEREVEKITEQSVEAEIFSTLTALVRRESSAMTRIQQLLASGLNELYILSMLAWQFRLLTQVKTGAVAGWSAAEIVRRYHLKMYSVTKSQPLVQAVSREYLLDTLTRILATDFAIKKGKVDARTGLNMLVLGLLAPAPR